MAENMELTEIQGLIMSGYAHLNHARYIFLQFPTNPTNGKAWLGAIAPQIATSEKWAIDPRTNQPQKPPFIVNLGINYTGLKALGIPEDDGSLKTFPDDFKDGIASERRSRILGDHGASAPEHWQIGKDQATLHLMLVILATDENTLEQTYTAQKALWEAHGLTVIAEEFGHRLPGSREHFGFLDGVSQPQFKEHPRKPKASEPLIQPGEFVIGYTNQYGIQAVSPKLHGKDLGKNGSYLVFRKLYQDVVGFWKYIQDNAANPDDHALDGMTPAERQVWLASKFVGRWPSGAPLHKYPDHDVPNLPKSELNDFRYFREDADGVRTPRGSHIRRSNPRDTNASSPEEALKTSDSHLIIRRGMSYGKPLVAPNTIPPQNLTDDGEDRGLIFLVINASISRQFEFVQQNWVNNTKFDRLYNDKDPLIGSNRDKEDTDPDTKTYDMTIERDPVRLRLRGLPRFVIVRGGGYFFMPSITALKMLSQA